MSIQWRMSEKLNHWVKLPDATLTVFRVKDDAGEKWGWRAMLVRSAKEGPIYGELFHETADSAKAAVLEKYQRMGGALP